jgi:hypothetical protein
MLVGLAGTDRSVHAFNLVGNTKFGKVGVRRSWRLGPSAYFQKCLIALRVKR